MNEIFQNPRHVDGAARQRTRTNFYEAFARFGFTSLRTLFAVALLILFVLPTHAETATQSRVYAIPAGLLTAVLNRFAEESGLLLTAPGELTEGQTSTGLQGRFTVEQGLRSILAGSGLQYRLDGEGVVTLIRAASRQDPVVLSAIVVQGELLNRTVQETRTSAVVVTGDQLEERGDTNVNEVLERTPGVTLAGAALIPSIRGVNQRGASANGAATISYTVDGAAISDFGLLVENGPDSTWDLEQIEILRGPQSTQRGRNALAGAINVRSRDPFMGEEFKVRGELGTYATEGLAVAANAANESETVAFRFAGDIKETDGFTENTVTGADDVGGTEDETVRVGFLLEPSDRLSAIVKLSHSDLTTGSVFIEKSAFPDDRIDNSNVENVQESEIDSLNLRVFYDFAPDIEFQFESTLLEADYFQQIDTDFSEADLGDFKRFRDFSSQQYEARIRYDSDRTRGIVGFLYAANQEDSVSVGTFPFGLAFATLTSLNEFDLVNLAAYGEIEHDLNDRFTLIGGLRYDREEIESFADRTITGAPFPPEDPTENDTTFDAWLPKVAVVYNISDDRSLGFTIQRGYRSGGASNVPAFGVVEFDPEFTTNYEVSYRSRAADGTWTLNANAFFTSWKDQQVSRGTSVLDTRVVNAGESEYYGFEVDGQWRPSAAIELFASAAYVHTEFLDFVDGGSDFSGNEFRDAPEWTAAAGATYFFDSGIYLRGDVSYTSSSFIDAANTVENDSRFLTNVRVGYRSGDWEAFAYANNLFDQDYAFGEQTAGGQTIARAGDPFTAGIVVQVGF